MADWKASWISPTRCLRMSVKRSRTGRLDAAKLQPVDQLLEVDGVRGVFRRVDLQVRVLM